jgi:hypothetical protein
LIIKIPLRVENLDPDSPTYLEMDVDLEDEFLWSVTSGVMTAALFVESGNPVWKAEDAAKMIRKLAPGASVSEVHDELVGISDIAVRAGVAAEGVRLWADGKRRASPEHPFPRVEQAITYGATTLRLYSWRRVVHWLRAVPGIDADEGIAYLDDDQLAELNATLHREQMEQPDIVFQAVKVPRVLESSVARAINFSTAGDLVSVRTQALLEYADPGKVSA